MDRCLNEVGGAKEDQRSQRCEERGHQSRDGKEA